MSPTSRRLLCWALVLLPIVFMVWGVFRYSPDAMRDEDWDLVPLVEKSFENTLTLKDLAGWNNEHRPLFPRILEIAVIRWSDGNYKWGLALNVLLSVGIFGMLVQRTERMSPWLLPPISILVFSWRQWACWTFQGELNTLLGKFCILGGLLQLAEPEFGWLAFLLAMACGTVAVYSTANGFLFWLLGLVVLAARPASRRVFLPIWIAATALLSWAYFGPGVPQEHLEGPRFALQHPGEAVLFFFTFLGSTTGIDGSGALIMGIAGTVLFLTLSPGRIRDRQNLPFVLFGTFALLNAALVAAGRTRFGWRYAAESRYNTMTFPFWICALILLSQIRLGPRMARAGAVLTFLATCAALRASLAARADSAQFFEDFKGAREAVRSGKDTAELRTLYPESGFEVVQNGIEILRKRRLYVFSP